MIHEHGNDDYNVDGSDIMKEMMVTMIMYDTHHHQHHYDPHVFDDMMVIVQGIAVDNGAISDDVDSLLLHGTIYNDAMCILHVRLLLFC